MGHQGFTSEQIITKLGEVDLTVGRTGTAVEDCRQIWMAEQTLYRKRCPGPTLRG